MATRKKSEAAAEATAGKKPKKAKAATAPTPKAAAEEAKQGVLRSIGDNGPRQEDFNFHWLSILGFHSKMREASDRYRASLKKADEAGIDTKAITAVLGYKNKDTDSIATYFKHLQKLFVSAQINVQVPLFDGEEGESVQLERPAEIFQEGYSLGAAGGTLKSDKYQPDSDSWNIFAQGWHAGQRSIIKISKTPPPKDSRGPVPGADDGADVVKH